MHQDYEHELKVAIRAVRAAAEICRSVQATITPEVLQKKDRSPVTIADFGSQAMVCRALEQAFPDDPVIGEEDASDLRTSENAVFLDRVCRLVGQTGLDATAGQICGWIDRGGAGEFSDRFWTLDPIDGTKGFLRGGQYAISLALIVDGKIDVALLGCPNLPLSPDGDETPGTILYAVRGRGASQIPLQIPGISEIPGISPPDGQPDATPVRVTETVDPSQARFCESVESGHSSHGHAAAVAGQLGITRDPQRLDSQAKYAVVARGEADLYLRLPTRADYREKIWDHAGGVLIVEEAGGTVTDVAGKPLEFTHGRNLVANRGVIVTNGLLHDRVLAALRECGVS